MAYTEAQRAYLVREQMIGPFVINFGLNAIIPWLMFAKQPHIPVAGPSSAMGDLIATMFLLPVLVCVIATPLIRLMARAGKVPAFTTLNAIPAWVRRLPSSLILRALVVGVGTALVVGPLISAFYAAVGWAEVDVVPFSLAKGVLCGIVAVLLSPPLAMRAIADVLAESRSASV